MTACIEKSSTFHKVTLALTRFLSVLVCPFDFSQGGKHFKRKVICVSLWEVVGRVCSLKPSLFISENTGYLFLV